jgi:hypothetical protein
LRRAKLVTGVRVFATTEQHGRCASRTELRAIGSFRLFGD